MKPYYIWILTFLSCHSIPQNRSNCFIDQGIKSAKIEAVLLSDTTQTVSGVIHFNTSGRPTFREDDNGKVEYRYDSNNLTHTIVHYTDGMSGVSKIDTNVVVQNDELGRPVKMNGADGKESIYAYQGCDEQLEEYKEMDGTLIYTTKSIFKDGLLVESIWNTNDDSAAQVTKYFDYKFDKSGYWTERKYQYSSGKLILESRRLEYY